MVRLISCARARMLIAHCCTKLLMFFYRLNEGFATYIEYKGVQSYESGWDMESKFLTADLHPVLELDATESSHPIVVDVSTPDEINAVFDTIAYSKGASVIRMMEDFMGGDDFRRGISNFLKKFSFQNAVTEDLLKELSDVSTEGLNVTHIMNTWTRQKGFRDFFSSFFSESLILGPLL